MVGVMGVDLIQVDQAIAALPKFAKLVEDLAAELERTRQAWVDGEDPMCDDVCQWACKGPCGVSQ